MEEQENKDVVAVEQLVEQLDGSNRRRRQEASHAIEAISREGAQELFSYADNLIDALGRPEAQTRWEVLSALSEMAKVDAAKVAGAFEGAEASLFDDGSATVRLAAFKFLTSYGASDPSRSDETWPLLDEAVQCYHGDPEYHDMLVSLLEFAKGSISEKASSALLSRVSFDAENGRGYIRAFSVEIAGALKRG